MSTSSPSETLGFGRDAALRRGRERMGPLFRDNQVLGRRNAIGCVALEITQRCNLVQNFMNASALDPERLHACSFMVQTAHGPVSMCAHNARRDDFILRPVKVETPEGPGLWDPLSGKLLPVVN